MTSTLAEPRTEPSSAPPRAGDAGPGAPAGALSSQPVSDGGARADQKPRTPRMTTQVGMLSRILDARGETLSRIGELALSYAQRGLRVFPCENESKQPLIDGGCRAATRDPMAIAYYWSRWPDAMIGVAMGPKSGLWAIDLDVDKGKNGLDDWDRLRAARGCDAETMVQTTPSGGQHWIFRWSEGLTITNANAAIKRKLEELYKTAGVERAAGIDVRGDGGYIIMAPSRRLDGRRYQRINDAKPALAPDWLVELLKKPEPPSSRQNVAPATLPPAVLNWMREQLRANGGSLSQRAAATGPRRGGGGNKERYARAALEQEFAQLRDTAEGGRNNALNIAAFKLGTLVGAGVLDMAEVQQRLMAACVTNGLVASDGAAAVAKSLDSGLRGGMAQPRDFSHADHGGGNA